MSSRERNFSGGSKWEDASSQKNRSSLEAAAEAAAKVNAMLIAKGKLKPSQLSQSQSKPKQSPSQGSNLVVAEVEINDVPISCRNMLTRGSTQDEISKMSGAAVSTRGRYMSPEDRLKNNLGERPLYLCVQGPTQQSVDTAVLRIKEIIDNSIKTKGPRFGARITGPRIGERLAPPRPQFMAPRPPLLNQPPPLMSLNPQPAGVNHITVMQDKLYIGLEHAPPSFDVKLKLLGPEGSYLQHIQAETGAKITLRGRGSAFIEPTTGREAMEPMNINMQHPTIAGLQQAKELSQNLIQTVQQEYAQFQQALAALPPPIGPGTATLLAGVQPQPAGSMTLVSNQLGQQQQIPVTVTNVHTMLSNPIFPPPSSLGSGIVVSTSQPTSLGNLVLSSQEPQILGLPRLLVNTNVPPPPFSSPETITTSSLGISSMPNTVLVNTNVPPPSLTGPIPGAQTQVTSLGVAQTSPGIQVSQPISALPPQMALPPGAQVLQPGQQPGQPGITFHHSQLPVQLQMQPPPQVSMTTSAQPGITVQPAASIPVSLPQGVQLVQTGQPQVSQPGQLQPGQIQIPHGQLVSQPPGQLQPGHLPPGQIQITQPGQPPQIFLGQPGQPQFQPGQLQPGQQIQPGQIIQPGQQLVTGIPGAPPGTLSLPPGSQPQPQPQPQPQAQPQLGEQPPRGPPPHSPAPGQQYYQQYVPQPSSAPTSVSTTATTSIPDHPQPQKRRFTEEKPEEKLPENLLGYQHGPPHLANLVASSPHPVKEEGLLPGHLQPQVQPGVAGPGQSPSHPNGTPVTQPSQYTNGHREDPDRSPQGNFEERDRNLMPPPPTPTGGRSSPRDKGELDKQLMPPPPPPGGQAAEFTADGEPNRKRPKGALGNVVAYEDEEDDVDSTLRKQQLEASKYSFNQYSGKPQIYQGQGPPPLDGQFPPGAPEHLQFTIPGHLPPGHQFALEQPQPQQPPQQFTSLGQAIYSTQPPQLVVSQGVSQAQVYERQSPSPVYSQSSPQPPASSQAPPPPPHVQPPPGQPQYTFTQTPPPPPPPPQGTIQYTGQAPQIAQHQYPPSSQAYAQPQLQPYPGQHFAPPPPPPPHHQGPPPPPPQLQQIQYWG